MTERRTKVEVRTRVEADVALRRAGLTDEEEKVLRMRYGIPIDPAAPLEERGQSNEQTRATLDAWTRRALGATQTGVDTERREAIIERLRRM